MSLGILVPFLKRSTVCHESIRWLCFHRHKALTNRRGYIQEVWYLQAIMHYNWWEPFSHCRYVCIVIVRSVDVHWSIVPSLTQPTVSLQRLCLANQCRPERYLSEKKRDIFQKKKDIMLGPECILLLERDMRTNGNKQTNNKKKTQSSPHFSQLCHNWGGNVPAHKLFYNTHTPGLAAQLPWLLQPRHQRKAF